MFDVVIYFTRKNRSNTHRYDVRQVESWVHDAGMRVIEWLDQDIGNYDVPKEFETLFESDVERLAFGT